MRSSAAFGDEYSQDSHRFLVKLEIWPSQPPPCVLASLHRATCERGPLWTASVVVLECVMHGLLDVGQHNA